MYLSYKEDNDVPFQPSHSSPARPLAKFGHDFPIDVDFHVLMVVRVIMFRVCVSFLFFLFLCDRLIGAYKFFNSFDLILYLGVDE